MKNKKFIIFSFTILFSLVFVWQGCKFEKIENPYSDEKFDAPEITYFWSGKVTDLKNVDVDMSGTKVSYTSIDGEIRETVVEGNNFSFSSKKPFSGEYNMIVEKDNYISSNKQFVYYNAKFRPLVTSNFKIKQLNAPKNIVAGEPVSFQEEGSEIEVIANVPEGTIFTLNGVEMDNVAIAITPVESGYLEGEKENIEEGKMGIDLATFDLQPKGLQFDNPMEIRITPSFAVGPDDKDDLKVAYKSKNSNIWDESTIPVRYDPATNQLVFEVESFGDADDSSDKKNILFGGGGSGNVYTSLDVTVETVKEGFVVYDYKISTNCTNIGSAINNTFTSRSYLIGNFPILEDALIDSEEGEIVRTTTDNYYTELSSPPGTAIENAITEYLIFEGTDLDANDRSGFYQILKANKTVENQMTFLDQEDLVGTTYADAYGNLDVTIDLCKSYILVCYYDVKKVIVSDITNASYTKYNGSYTRFIAAGNVFLEEIDCPNVTPCHQGGGSGSGK